MEEERTERISPALLRWIIITLVVAAGSVLYRVLVLNHLEQTSLLFIGIPLLLSIGIACGPQPKSVTGVILKGITLALMLSGILFIEGFICILMASPLFYLIGGIIGFLEERRRRKKDTHTLNCFAFGVIGLLSLEGVTDRLSFGRAETVIVEQSLNLSVSEARALMNEGPDFNLKERPPFLRLGMPLPRSIEGTGTSVDDTWKIHFAGGEGKPGDLLLKVTESSPSHVTYTCISDKSHVAHWMDWKTIHWTLEENGADECRIRLVLNYDRLLDPAWYFKPIERYGVKVAGEYLISQTFHE